MRDRTVRISCRPILLLPVLGLLQACMSGPDVIYKERVVKVPTPVIQPVDPRLTADCVPSFDVPATGPITVRDLVNRLEAVEFALEVCRNDKAELRKSQPR